MNLKERFPMLQNLGSSRYAGLAAVVVTLALAGGGAYWYYADYRPNMLQTEENDWMSEFAGRQKYFFDAYSDATASAAQAVYFDKGTTFTRASRQLPGEIKKMQAALSKVQETLSTAGGRLYRRANNNTETLTELKAVYAAYGSYGESLDAYASFLLKGYDPRKPETVAQKKQMGDALREGWAKRRAAYQDLTRSLTHIDSDLADQVMTYVMVKDNDIGRTLGRVKASLAEFK
jgi:hypothetical protein